VSLIKCAASKWKSMLHTLSDSDAGRLSHLVPPKEHYAQRMTEGVLRRRAALEGKHGIKITHQLLDSQTINPEAVFGAAGKGMPEMAIPLPHASVAVDSKNFVSMGPRSPAHGALASMNGVKNVDEAKILDAQGQHHELSEIRAMSKFLSKKEQVSANPSMIRRIASGTALNDLPHKELNTWAKSPIHQMIAGKEQYRSHFDKKVLNYDNNFISKTPYKDLSGYVRTLRSGE